MAMIRDQVLIKFSAGRFAHRIDDEAVTRGARSLSLRLEDMDREGLVRNWCSPASTLPRRHLAVLGGNAAKLFRHANLGAAVAARAEHLVA